MQSNVPLPEKVERLRSSYDIVGDIAIIRMTEASGERCAGVAEAIMSVHHNVRTVLAQAGPVRGDFRVRELRHVAGEKKTITKHVESGCAFSVDVSKCYFSPRLSYERMRVAGQITEDEVVVNMFAGVGCFSVLIAKYSNASRVYSIDVNPVAFQYMQDNIRLNGAYGKVVPMMGDAREVIEKKLRHVGDRILMPLPEKALDCLPYSLLALKTTGGWIHYYGFEHSKRREDAIDKVKLKAARKLADLGAVFDFPLGRVVRSTGPNWYQVVLDIFVKGQSGKFNKRS